MNWLYAPDEWIARFVLERGMALIYLVAFVNVRNQFRPLLGARGLMPAPRFLAAVRFRDAPSLFHARYSDGLLAVVAWCGIGLAVLELSTLPDRLPAPVAMIAWALLWALYLSVVNVGQTFYAFGWESLLLEAGFLTVFLGAWTTAPPVVVMWLFRWLLFRLEFGAGLIKLRGDSCWRDLTCLQYHHETQPMPNPLSRWFHLLPRPVHRFEVLGNHAAQLVAPLLLFTPQPIAGGAAAFMILTQLWLVLSGNFAWLNWLTIVIAVAALPDTWLAHLVPVSVPAQVDGPLWFSVTVLALTVAVAVLSWWPVRNLLSSHQHMNASFNSLHLVNSYGAFGSVTRVRNEVVVEGTDEAVLTPSSRWWEYRFRGKPTDTHERPRQVAPYHLRLDWLMWFAALSPSYARPWLIPFLARLLRNDPATLKLLHHNPFAEQPPRFVRARLYRYRFTTRAEHRASHDCWERELLTEYVAPLSLEQ